MKLITLILSLPTENATVRMRAWRMLKASGAAVLRDGVYLLPERESCRETMTSVATAVLSSGGTAYVMRVEEPDGANFRALFDHDKDYLALLADAARIRAALSADSAPTLLKQTRKLRKAYLSLTEIDFFPSAAQQQTAATLQDLDLLVARVMAPDEPHPVNGTIARRLASEYQGRIWATRQRPWVDRLACAWLIRRFIDPQASLLWLSSPADCPAEVLGFDFDGATFSHTGNRVSFEVLQASFALEQPALNRLGALVHYLDVGGWPPPEALGVETVLAGLRATINDDHQLVTAADAIFDGLLAGFQEQSGACTAFS